MSKDGSVLLYIRTATTITPRSGANVCPQHNDTALWPILSPVHIVTQPSPWEGTYIPLNHWRSWWDTLPHHWPARHQTHFPITRAQHPLWVRCRTTQSRFNRLNGFQVVPLLYARPSPRQFSRRVTASWPSLYICQEDAAVRPGCYGIDRFVLWTNRRHKTTIERLRGAGAQWGYCININRRTSWLGRLYIYVQHKWHNYWRDTLGPCSGWCGSVSLGRGVSRPIASSVHVD